MFSKIFFNIYKRILIFKFNKKWAKKEMLFCPSIYGEINFTYSMVRLCSLCTLEPLTPPIFYVAKHNDYSNLNFKQYMTQLDRIMTLNLGEKPVCEGCEHIKKQRVPKLKFSGNITRFSFNHFTKCNADCVYCSCVDKTKDVTFNILPIIKRFEKYSLISKDCLFNWAGGEPIICKDFNECCSYLAEKGYKQIINSSGIEYSELVEKCLKENTAELLISPDSGTRETYLKIKRVDCFNQVWENIKKYAALQKKFTVKYVLFSYNANEKDIRGFIDKCIWAKVPSIAITVENNTSHGDGLKYGPITQNEINMAILLKNLAKEHSINCLIWPMWPEKFRKQIEQG